MTGQNKPKENERDLLIASKCLDEILEIYIQLIKKKLTDKQ